MKRVLNISADLQIVLFNPSKETKLCHKINANCLLLQNIQKIDTAVHGN